MIKKFKGICLTIVIIVASLPMCYTVSATSDYVGKYIEFGKYENEPVLYRIIGESDVNHDGTNELMLASEYILSYKAYDSNGDLGTFVKWWDQAAYDNMVRKGSARWDRSAIRSWLNSDQDTVVYSPNSENPSLKFVKKNPYDTEKGFMANGNMTDRERELIVPVTHNSLVSDIDFPRDDASSEELALYGGTKAPSSVLSDSIRFNEYITLDQALADYDNVYHQMTTDKVFLLSLKEFKNGNFKDIDGKDHSEGVEKTAPHNAATFLLRDEFGATELRHIKGKDQVGWYGDANDGARGVRPAMYIDSTADLVGIGTIEDPFALQKETSLKDITFNSDSNVLTDIKEGNIDVIFNMEPTNVNKDITLFVNLYKKYDNTQTMINSWEKAVTVSENEYTFTCPISVSDAQNTYLRAYVWDNITKRIIMGSAYTLGDAPKIQEPQQIEQIVVNDKTVTFKGNTKKGGNREVAIIVAKADSDIKNSENIIYSTQLITLANGNYFDSFKVKEDFSGWLDLYISINGDTDVPIKKIGIAGEDTINNMVSILNSKKADEILQMLNGKYPLEYEVLKKSGYLIDEFEQLGENKIKVPESIVKSDVVFDKTNMKKMLDTAILATLYNGFDASGKKALLQNVKYESLFNISDLKQKEYYKKIMNSENAVLLINTVNEFVFPCDFGELLRQSGIFITLNKAQNADIVKSLIEEESVYLGIVFNSSYNNLKDFQKLEVFSEFLGETFTTKKSILEKYNQALQNVIDSLTPPLGGGGSSSGGSNSSSSSNSTVTIEKEYVEQKKEELKEKVIFDDIDNVLWAKEAINSLYNKNIISGKEVGKFFPNDNIKREELAKIIVKFLDLTQKDDVNTFGDVEDAWYLEYVLKVSKAGIMKGITPENFGIGQFVTREDMAVILDRVAKIKNIHIVGEDITFSDENEISAYAKDSVYNLAKLGIINGIGDNKFAPKIAITRAETAKMIYCLSNEN